MDEHLALNQKERVRFPPGLPFLITRGNMRQHPPEVRAQISASIKYLYENRPFEKLGRRHKRLYIIEEQGGKCLWCGISKWREKPISFEMDHIDGDRKNSARENLRVLCPNCHSQTSTHGFTGRHHTDETKIVLVQARSAQYHRGVA